MEVRYNKGTYAVVMFASNPGTVHWISNGISDAPQEDRKGKKNLAREDKQHNSYFVFNKVNVMN